MREGGRKAPFQGHEEYASLEAICRDFGKCDAIYDTGEKMALRASQKGLLGKCMDVELRSSPPNRRAPGECAIISGTYINFQT